MEQFVFVYSSICNDLFLKKCFLYVCREYYWANYVTGLGASLHELGHTFDLAHTATGVMARGFDDLHKVSMLICKLSL